MTEINELNDLWYKMPVPPYGLPTTTSLSRVIAELPVARKFVPIAESVHVVITNALADTQYETVSRVQIFHQLKI